MWKRWEGPSRGLFRDWEIAALLRALCKSSHDKPACQLLMTAAVWRNIDPTRGSIAILSLICNVPSPHAEGISHNHGHCHCPVSGVTIVSHVTLSNPTFSRRGLAHDADGDFLVNGMYLWSRKIHVHFAETKMLKYFHVLCLINK